MRASRYRCVGRETSDFGDPRILWLYRLEALRIIISGHATASRSYGLLATTVWSAEHAHGALADQGVGAWSVRTVNFNQKGDLPLATLVALQSSPFRALEFPLDSRALIRPATPSTSLPWSYCSLQFLLHPLAADNYLSSNGTVNVPFQFVIFSSYLRPCWGFKIDYDSELSVCPVW